MANTLLINARQAVLGNNSLLPPSMRMVAPSRPSPGEQQASASKAPPSPPPAPLLVSSYSIPTSTAIDRRLIVGALVFGAGWGISGICPGPALVSSVGAAIAAVTGAMPLSQAFQVLPYLLGLTAGFWLEPRVAAALSPQPTATTVPSNTSSKP